MINPTDPPIDQQIHCFKPTDQPIQTHHQPIQTQLVDPRWSNLQNPKPRGWRWSFRDERVDGEIEKEEREENKNNERDERQRR